MDSPTAEAPSLAGEVLERARSLLERVAVTGAQHEALLAGLAHLEPSIADVTMPACIHLPVLAYGAVRRDLKRAIPLAAATALLNAGRHLLDDVVDGQLEATEGAFHPGEAVLLGAGFLCVLPQLVLLELDAPLACRVRLQRTLLAGLVRMHAGQQSDLALTGSGNPSPLEVEASARGKTGATYAMYAALGAKLANAPPWQVERLTAMGLAFGTAFQFGSDCADVLGDGHSADLAAGTRTLPLALYLSRLTDADRPPFLCLLEEARTNSEAQAEVRARLRRSGAVRACGIVVEAYRQRALQALDEAHPEEPAASSLREMIDRVAIFPPKA